MAIILPSNLTIPAAAYLDKRTGLASTINDLRNWDFTTNPIPVGFEVCVDGRWYTYQGRGENIEIDTLTGYFKERGGINVVQEAGSSEDNVMSQKAVTDNLNSLSDRIQEIIENLGIILEIKEEPIYDSDGTLSSNGGGLYEVGTQVTPMFGWKVYYNGSVISPGTDPSDNGTYNTNIYRVVTNESGTEIEERARGTITTGTTEDPYISIWQGEDIINSDTKLRVRTTYGTGVGQLTAYLDIDYKFVNKKTWGYITTSPLEIKIENIENFLNGNDGKIIGSELSLTRELSLTVLDCSDNKVGGVYPIYIVPASIYNSEDDYNIRVLVGNMEVSTYEISSNPYYINNGITGYMALIFSVKQNGVLNIEIKNYE